MSNARGIIACFESPEHLLAVLHRARAAGYTRIDAFTPFPVEGLDEALPRGSTPIGWIVWRLPNSCRTG